MNDAELRQVTGKATISSAAREVLALGPDAVLIKQGEYGAALLPGDGFLSLPRSRSIGWLIRPAPATASRAGWRAMSRRGPARRSITSSLATTMAYGTAVASFSVEEFGTERLARLTMDEVEDRVAELHAMTRFTHPWLRQAAA